MTKTASGKRVKLERDGVIIDASAPHAEKLAAVGWKKAAAAKAGAGADGKTQE